MPLTTAQFIANARAKHGTKYNYEKVVYEGSGNPVTIICPDHGEFQQVARYHTAGAGCQECRNISMRATKTESREEYLKKAIAKHGDRYDYSKVVYEGSRTKIEIICRDHGSFMQSPYHHLLGHGCHICGRASLSATTTVGGSFLEDRIASFFRKALNIHGDTYDYSRVDYKNCFDKVEIICRKHCSFFVRPCDHISERGGFRGCEDCKIEKYLSEYLARFTVEATAVHNGEYDYSKAELIRRPKEQLRIKMICRWHGEFVQETHHHLKGGRCPRCSLKLYSTEDFIKVAREEHGEKYDYHHVQYVNTTTPVRIICQFHGEFLQTPHAHLKGTKCPTCTRRVSIGQIQWLNWLACRQRCTIQHAENGGEIRIPGSRYHADGFCEESRTVYEYNGDVFHGNPDLFRSDEMSYFGKAYGDLYRETLARTAQIEKLGYRVICIWESEWKRHLMAVRIIQRAWRKVKNLKRRRARKLRK